MGSTTQTVPGAPTGLAAEPGDAQVTLSWTSGGDGGSAITKHQYRQKAGSGSYGSWTDIPTSAAGETNATSFTVTTGLGNGTAYTFQVRAVNAQGDGTASGEAERDADGDGVGPDRLLGRDHLHPARHGGPERRHLRDRRQGRG